MSADVFMSWMPRTRGLATYSPALDELCIDVEDESVGILKDRRGLSQHPRREACQNLLYQPGPVDQKHDQDGLDIGQKGD